MENERIDDVTTERSTMRAEDLTPAGRIALLALAFVPAAVATAAAIAAFVWPEGLFHLEVGLTLPFLAVGVTFLTVLVHGALLEGNPALDEHARRVWTAAFVIASPIPMPVYWWAHVRPARRG